MEADPKADWAATLSEALDCPVAIDFGRSRTTPIQAKHERLRGRDGLRVRMHGAMFATAPAEVREAVAKWLRSGRRARRAGAVLDEWIATRLKDLPSARRRATALCPRGDHHDLERLAAPLFETEFADDFEGERRRPGITWGTRRKSRSRHSLRLGSYDVETNVVRLHPVLDQLAVPEWFVAFVLMHEILHAALPPHTEASGRMIHHSRAFRARERELPGYDRVLTWERDNLPRLIASARRGTPMRVRKEGVRRGPVEILKVWVQGELY